MSDAGGEKAELDARESAAAGRGGVFVLGAKVFFIVVGFVQQALLNAAIGLSEYGALSRVLAHANILNNVVVQGSIQGVSRRVAPVRERFGAELRACLRVHVPLAFVLAAAFALLAEPIGAFQKAPHIVAPLRVMAVVALAYGTYAPLVGALNGRSLFGRQAALDVLFATLRTAGLVGVGYAFAKRGSGALGATVGFALAALLIVPLAAVWAARRPDGASAAGAVVTPIAGSVYLTQLFGVALAQLFTNALMQVDIALLGRFLSAGAATTLGAGVEATRASDEWVGVYRACQLFAFLPYQLVLSVAQVLFPMVARAHASGDRAAVAAVVARGMRVATLLGGCLVAVVAANPRALLTFAYGEVVGVRGESALRVLALGQGAFALFGVSATVLVSLGRERTSALLSGASLLVVAAACAVLVPNAAFGATQLVRTAAATALGLGAGLAGAAWLVRSASGAFVTPRVLLRVAAAVVAALAVGAFVPPLPRAIAPLPAAASVVVYLVVLVATGELGAADRAALRRLAKR